jgi:tetratricopeptide (TPR) repeat protein
MLASEINPGRRVIRILIVLFLAVSTGFTQAAEENGLAKANEYFFKNMYDEAINAYTKVIQNKPESELAYRNRGISYRNKGDFDSAIFDFSKVIEIKPDDAKGYFMRGITYYKKGDMEQAISDFSKAIEIGPEDGMSYLQRGIAYKAKGDFEKSSSDLDKTLEIFSRKIENNPEDYMAYNNRGIAYQKKDDLNQAIDDYNKSVDIQPNPYAYANRAEAYFSKKEYAKSREDVFRAEGLVNCPPLDKLKNALRKATGEYR